MTAEEETAAGTGYSHTAIALAGERVLEASNGGVKIVSLGTLLEDYDHIAVLRYLESDSLWDAERLDSLENFATQAEAKGFNQIGLMRFHGRKKHYQNDLMERIEDYFEGTASEVTSKRGVYFCSELIVAAFIHVGMIAQSAAVVFTPETFSPSDVAKDKAFGFFFGYVRSSPGYVVPEGDFFKHSI